MPEVQSACTTMPVLIPSDAGPAKTFQELLPGPRLCRGACRIVVQSSTYALLNCEKTLHCHMLPHFCRGSQLSQLPSGALDCISCFSNEALT